MADQQNSDDAQAEAYEQKAIDIGVEKYEETYGKLRASALVFYIVICALYFLVKIYTWLTPTGG